MFSAEKTKGRPLILPYFWKPKACLMASVQGLNKTTHTPSPHTHPYEERPKAPLNITNMESGWEHAETAFWQSIIGLWACKGSRGKPESTKAHCKTLPFSIFGVAVPSFFNNLTKLHESHLSRVSRHPPRIGRSTLLIFARCPQRCPWEPQRLARNRASKGRLCFLFA